MAERTAERPLWKIVSNLEHDEIESWRKRYRSSLAMEDALTQGINVVETTIARRPGGNILVTVSIIAKKPFECSSNAFRLQRAGNRVYKVLDPDSASTSE